MSYVFTIVKVFEYLCICQKIEMNMLLIKCIVFKLDVVLVIGLLLNADLPLNDYG